MAATHVLHLASARAEIRAPRRRLLRLRRLATIAAVVFAMVTFFGQAAMVPTASMEHTVLVGDHLLMLKLPYAPKIPFTPWHLPRLHEVARGEIVAFASPTEPGITYLKRAVAVGGDVVEIREGQLYRNGVAVKEQYVEHRGLWQWSREENFGPLRVPPGQLFMLGDNRENSQDSRYWGTVPETSVVGRPLFVMWSYDAPSSEWLDERPLHQVRFYTSVALHLFVNTRWYRTGERL